VWSIEVEEQDVRSGWSGLIMRLGGRQKAD
jgi:hypothetical protein